MPGRMDFDFTFGGAKSALSPTRESDDPLRILILGNFSGVRDTTKPRVPLRQRPIVRLDIDNFDAVLRRFSPQVQLGSDASNSLAETVEIQELEDFRPERLCQKLPTLRRLVELRKSLLNPATFEQAAAQLKQQWMVAPTIPDGSFNEPPPPVTSAENDAGTLERILGQATPSPKSPAGGSPFDVQRAIGQMIQPYLVPAADPNQKVYLAALNNALGEQLRTVLHDRSFQSLEATWRSLRGLISKIEDEGQVQIHLLDIASDELLHQVPANDDDLQQWSLYRRLADEPAQVPGTTPWSLIIGDFTITARTNDLTLLGALTAVAQHLRTPVIAAGDSTVLGASSLTAGLDPADWQPLAAESDQYWQALRGSPAAAWVGLVCPRVLLRLPYGQETDEIESFEFEEFVSKPRHEQFRWGNSAYLCADLVMQAFAADGWSMQLGSQLDIDDLPAYTYRDDGEVHLQPCAEVVFGERVAAAFLQRGLMPLMSWRDRNAVRFVRFQSIANPPTALAGPWS